MNYLLEAKKAFNKIEAKHVLLGVGLFVVIKSLGGNSKINPRDLPPTGDGSSPLISNAEVNSVAGSVYRGMDRVGTDEDLMYSVLAPLNGADLGRVFVAFGRKQYFIATSGTYIGTKIDLFGWFREELNQSELAQMQNIWTKANMTI
jgi:hypothetical protein